MHISFFERLLQFAHSAADHRARTWTGRVNEISDPDFARQLRGTKRLPLLIQQLKTGHGAIGRNIALTQRVDLQLTQPKQQSEGNERDQDQSQFPHNPAMQRRTIDGNGAGIHNSLTGL